MAPPRKLTRHSPVVVSLLSISALSLSACDPKEVFKPTEDAHIRFAAPQAEVIMNVPAGTTQTLEIQKSYFRSQPPITLEVARRNDRLEVVGMHDSLADGIIENPSWYLTQNINLPGGAVCVDKKGMVVGGAWPAE